MAEKINNSGKIENRHNKNLLISLLRNLILSKHSLQLEYM